MNRLDISNVRWKELFEARILGRGYDYYLEGNVWDVQVKDGYVSAFVEGSEDYHVTISIQDEKITDMDCSCPYAADGNYCKHEAAVLYELTESAGEDDYGQGTESALLYARGDTANDQELEYQEEPSWRTKLEAERSELMHYLEVMPDEDMRDLLYQLACNDDSLRNRIVTMYSENIDEKLILRLRAMVDEIEYRNGDRSGFIDWRHASVFIGDMIEFLDSNVDPLIQRGMIAAAFDLTCYVFLTIGNAEIDDDGDIEIGARECIDYWKKIASQASDEQQEKMYDWFSCHVGNGSVIDYMEDYIEEFRMTGFHSRSLLHKRLEELDVVIARDAEEYRKYTNSWKVHGLIRNILNRIETMTELEMPHSEIIAYMERYTYLPKILLEYAELIYTDGNLEYAVELLQKGKTRDADDEIAASAYSGKIIDFYSRSLASLEGVYNNNDIVEDDGIAEYNNLNQNIKNNLADELRFQVMNYYQRDLHYVEMLKEQTNSENWETLREEILTANSCGSIRLDLLRSEKLYERLMDELLAKDDIFTLGRYEKDLRRQFPEKIRDMYADYVTEAIHNTSNRKQYNYIVTYLSKMRRYEGGKELAQSIAEEWKFEYKRRPALLDELSKAGF